MSWPKIIHPRKWPPFVVPPEDLGEWDDSFYREFASWKRRDVDRLNMSEEDFRQYVVEVNSEFNFEEILDKIDIGLDAFEKLNKFMPRFPGFDLIKELDNFYDEKNIDHVRDFIMLGAEYVKSLDNAELSQLDTSTTANIKQEKPEAVTNEADDIKKEVFT